MTRGSNNVLTLTFSQQSAQNSGLDSAIRNLDPQIGTLTVLVDRARNLPNQAAPKTQAPYCRVEIFDGYSSHRQTRHDPLGGGTPFW